MIDAAASVSDESTDGDPQAKKGTLKAILPQITASQRDALHKRITLCYSLFIISASHRGDEIQLATKKACSAMHIGHYREDVAPGDGVDTVHESMQNSGSNNASNIISGWECFDGWECNDHTLALIVPAEVATVFRKLREHADSLQPLRHWCQAA
ncbi:hypothetical protein CYMTET_56957 [Cymbomonas tetramitiformis]|uniref:Uncharacterized protein n=1 Tax=Cymbomonas tetramitiformis TaxID=36881 RepID=A0AAE0ELG6_9CHLO|nr:hypothetical protein CYMTET_56957 [Cymbomonas tetramitiformis]